jgi:hypothetical protein
MPDFTEPIEMELHIIGGFLDKDGTSQQLSTLLVERINHLAEKVQGSAAHSTLDCGDFLHEQYPRFENSQ